MNTCNSRDCNKRLGVFKPSNSLLTEPFIFKYALRQEATPPTYSTAPLTLYNNDGTSAAQLTQYCTVYHVELLNSSQKMWINFL